MFDCEPSITLIICLVVAAYLFLKNGDDDKRRPHHKRTSGWLDGEWHGV